MATYDNPQSVTYSHPVNTLSSSDVTKVLRGPPGRRGRLLDIGGSVTTTTAGATTTPHIQVGISGDLTKFADYDVGAVTAPDGFSGNTGIKRDATTQAEQVIPADTDLYVTYKAASGSGAAGVVDGHITIGWY